MDGVTPSPRVTRRRTPRPPTLPPTPPRPTEQASPTEQPPQPAVGVQLGSINEIRAEIRRFIERDVSLYKVTKSLNLLISFSLPDIILPDTRQHYQLT